MVEAQNQNTSQPQTQPQASQQTTGNLDDNFDTAGLLLDYLAHWKWFVLAVIVSLIGAYFYISTIVPTYQVTASIFLSQDTDRAKNAVSLNPGDPLVAMKNYIDETELEMLKSRNNLMQIVDSLGLSYSYAMKGRLRDIPLYGNNAVVASLDSVSLRNLKSPITASVKSVGDGVYDIKVETHFNGIKESKTFDETSLPIDIELSHGTLTLSKSPTADALNGTEKIVIRNPRNVAGAISGGLTIEYARNSQTIIRIAYNTPIINQGVDVINTLIEFYNRQIIKDKNRSAIQTEAFILDRLVMINGELKDVENRLQAYRESHNITNIDAQATMNLQLKSNYETELADIDAQLSILEEIESLVTKAETYQTLPAVVNDENIVKLIEAYNRKVDQLNRALEGSTDSNPLVASMRDELTRDKSRIVQNMATARRNLLTSRNAVNSLASRSSGQLAQLPPIDKGFQEIFREQQVKVNIYTFLLQKREEIALQKTLATNTARLIDDPVGSGPVAPRRNVIFGVAFLLGLLIPAAIIFMRRVLFPIFKDQEELERLTRIPIIGEICKTNEKPALGDIVVGENVSTSIAELFRLLRNNIGFTRGGNGNRVILVTSSISGEGKTFVASNLAMTYALTGKKTLVVGMDIRRPLLARRFGLDNQRGITTYLSGQETDVRSLIHQTKLNDNLYVLPAGPVPPNPNELLMSPNMDNLIAQLRKDFDYVTIDSAPIGIISDTFLIIRHTDLQLYVTRASFSSKSTLKSLHHAFDLNKFKSVYIVLNGVDMRASSYLYRRYGQYGHYYTSSDKTPSYGYGYGSTSEGHRHHKHKSSKDK